MTEQLARIAIDNSHSEDGYDVQDSASELTSLRSSIMDYVYENGRRYHAYHAGTYWGSNDEKSMDAMDILHHLYSLLLHGKLFLAPIPDNVKRVLDVGTGTGKWAIDFGDLYPWATVIGTDLSPIQPGFTPPNVHFEVDDCCDEWIYSRPFDLIHIRGLYGCIADWNKLYSQALQHLQPGGFIEQVEASAYVESDDGSHENTTINEIGAVGQQAGKQFGKSLNTLNEMKDGMIKAGFTDVTVHHFKMPVGPWPKDKHLKTIGRYTRLVWEESLEMWTMYLFTNVLGWSREAVEVYLADVRKDLYNPKIHAYNVVRVCHGRKPTAEEVAGRATA